MLASEFLLDFHSPSHRFEGGKPGKFSDFISAAESAGWRELGCFRGLGKIWDKSGFFLIWVGLAHPPGFRGRESNDQSEQFRPAILLRLRDYDARDASFAPSGSLS